MVEFVDHRRVPPYAILSHTWEDEEITFHELLSMSPDLKVRKSWSKLVATCSLALGQKLEFVWIDTCCIDKSSSAELAEAINSMFSWYMQADRCYVYLSNFKTGSEEHVVENLPKCRWWTRGWTLQELIAPADLDFYDCDWSFVGTKRQMVKMVTEITSIPEDVLLDGRTFMVSRYSVAARMSWAACRETTRLEDEAYCLLGLFDVNMPLIYSEGRKAFHRLQEEIVKRHNDLTILGHTIACTQGDTVVVAEASTSSLFALFPAQFQGCSNIYRLAQTIYDFAVTNRGLRFTGQLRLHYCQLSGISGTITGLWMALGFSLHADYGEEWGIVLQKVGRRLFRRDPDCPHPVEYNSIQQIRVVRETDIYILMDPPHYRVHKEFIQQPEIYVPECAGFDLINVVPDSLWNCVSRRFLNPDSSRYEHFLTDRVLAICLKVRSTVTVLVLCDCSRLDATVKVVAYQEPHAARYIHRLLFQQQRRENSMSWTDLEFFMPNVEGLTNCTRILIDDKPFLVSAELHEPFIEPPRSAHTYELLFDLQEDLSEVG